MTPRSIASRLLENDEDFDVSGELQRLITTHPGYEIESEDGHWNVYKKVAGQAAPAVAPNEIAFIGEITYDDMADMPRETMTPEQIAHWETHHWYTRWGWRDNEHTMCKSFDEAVNTIIAANAVKTRVRESTDPDDPAIYTNPEQFTKQPSYEKIESDLRIMLRPYYDEVRINRRPHKFAEVFKGLRDYYRWTIHCNRTQPLKLPNSQFGAIDWRQQAKSWFHDWSERSALHITEFEIHGRLRVDPTFQFTTWRLPENGVSVTGKVLKENEEDDLTPEQFLAHHIDKQRPTFVLLV